MPSFNFFRKKETIATRRTQRDLLSDRLTEAESATAKAREAATELALEAASDAALAKAEQSIRQCEDRERTLRDAIAVSDSELAEQVAAEAAAADRKVREATARELCNRADKIEKGLTPLLAAVRNSAADIELSRQIVGEIGIFELFERLHAELPPAFALIAGELRTRAALTIDGHAPATLPVLEVIAPPAPPIPCQQVFLLKDAKWRNPARPQEFEFAERFSFANVPEALAHKAIELGVAVLPEDERVARLKFNKRGAPPHPATCHDLDTGEAPAPSGPLPWDAFRRVDRGGPFKVNLAPPASFEPAPAGARGVTIQDNETNDHE